MEPTTLDRTHLPADAFWPVDEIADLEWPLSLTALLASLALMLLAAV